MSDKQIEAVRIGDSNPSPDLKGTPLRSIFCLKNRDEIKKFEEEEDCFILEFDPYDVLDMSKASLTDDIDHAEADLRITAEKGQGTPLRSIFCLKNRDESKKHEAVEDCFILEFDPYDDLNMLKASLSDDFDNDEADLCITAEKGKVACRDYPHPRHTCAKYPFEKTPHDRHCKLCYCYVCDLAAPCSKWAGFAGHCHAFNNEAWNNKKKLRKNLAMTHGHSEKSSRAVSDTRYVRLPLLRKKNNYT